MEERRTQGADEGRGANERGNGQVWGDGEEGSYRNGSGEAEQDVLE